jgi:hypothetical protein
MGSQRAQKVQQRAQRQAKRQARRARNAEKEIKKAAQRDPRIGYVAGRGAYMLCDGDACIVAGSHEKMRQIVQRCGGPMAAEYKIHVTGLERILQCLQRGEAYCFDEEAYGRFVEPARRRGVPLTDEDFSDPGPHGLHFVRVQWIT